MPPFLRFSCPRCARALPVDPGGGTASTESVGCEPCGHSYRRVDGIWRFLVDEDAHREFSEAYRSTRQAEGWGSLDAAYLRALPSVPADDAHAWIWRIRSRSFEALRDEIRSLRPQTAVELGAGNSWLAYRLSEAGIRTAAVDLSDDEADGLGAWRAYGDPPPFEPVQAELDRLPFSDGVFEMAIFNGSFHYAQDALRSLREALRVLGPEGRLVIVDTPFYPSEADGVAMLEESGRHDRVGFLCPSRLDETAETLGLTWHRRDLPMGWRWRVKNQLRGLTGRRRLAAFPLLVAVREAQAGSEIEPAGESS